MASPIHNELTKAPLIMLIGPRTNWTKFCRYHFSSMQFIQRNFTFDSVLIVSVSNKSALLEVKAWYQTGSKPLPEPMMTELEFLNLICVIRTELTSWQCGKLNFWHILLKTDVPHMFFIIFHSPSPIVYLPSSKFARIGKHYFPSLPWR